MARAIAEPAAVRVAGLSDEQVRGRVTRLDELLDRLDGIPGPGTEMAMEAIELLTEVYGTVLARIVAMLDDGTASVPALAADEVVGHLMLLHGLHPDPPEQRIARVLDEVRPQLDDKADVTFTGIENGVAHLTVTAPGCPSTAGAMAASIRNEVLAAAPELVDVVPVTARPRAAPAMIPVDALLRRPGVVR